MQPTPKQQQKAREIVEHVSSAALELAFIRHSLSSDEFDHADYPDVASEVRAQEEWWEEIKSDTLNCLTGDDTGCLDAEDLDTSNCELLWVAAALVDAGGPQGEQCAVTCTEFALHDCKGTHRCVKDAGHPFDPVYGDIHEFESHQTTVKPRIAAGPQGDLISQEAMAIKIVDSFIEECREKIKQSNGGEAISALITRRDTACEIYKLLTVASPGECIWTYDDIDNYWQTSCGEQFCVAEETPTKNGMKFCHSCGLKLVEQQAKESWR